MFRSVTMSWILEEETAGLVINDGFALETGDAVTRGILVSCFFGG